MVLGFPGHTALAAAGTTTTAAMERNGRRSRGPSPNANNGGASPDTSSDDENSAKKLGKTVKKSEYEEKIRVGRDYQAVCPDMVPPPDRKPETVNDRALLVWSPTKEITDTKLEDYITVAKEKYGYNGEQALGMLFWHKHDLERAVMDLANFTPFPDEWTIEDKVLFEQAFQFHGKSFHRIRQMLPDKSIPSLVKFYYSWKKTRNRTSVMDRQEKVKKVEGSENGSEHGSNEDSDNEEKKWPIHRGIQRGNLSSKEVGGGSAAGGGTSTSTQGSHTTSGTGVSSSSNGASSGTAAAAAAASTQNTNINTTVQPTIASKDGDLQEQKPSSEVGANGNHCEGCGVLCNEVNGTPKGKLCNSCFQHWRRTGSLRPTSGPPYMGKRPRNTTAGGGSGGEKHKRKPPRGMYINHDDIVTLASNPNSEADQLLSTMDREVVALMSQIQQNKQSVGSLKRKNSDASDDLRPNDLNGNGAKINSRWSNEEVLLVVQGIKKYGKDFQAIAETIGSKSAGQVRLFFTNHKRKYDLDGAMKEFYKQQQLMSQDNGQTKPPITIIEDIMEIDLDDDESNDGSKSEKTEGPLLLPEVTITKTTDLVASLKTAAAGVTNGGSDKTGSNNNINNNNNNNSSSSVKTTASATVVTVADEDDDVIMDDAPMPAAAINGAQAPPPPPLKSIPAAIK